MRGGLRDALIIAALCVVAAAVALFAYLSLQTWRHPPRLSVLPYSTVRGDLRLGFDLQPDLVLKYPVGNGKTFDIFTDKNGVRIDGAHGKTLTSATAVAIGDSQVFGWGIANADTFISRAGRALGVSTANLGVSGYGTVSATRRLEAFRSLAPRVVVLGFYYDHPFRNVSHCSPAASMLKCVAVPHVVRTNGGLAIAEPEDNRETLADLGEFYRYASAPGGSHSFLRDFYWKVRISYSARVYQNSYLDTPAGLSPGLQEETAYALKLLHDQVRKMGASLVIVYIPDYFKEKVVRSASWVRETALHLDVPFIDMSDDLQAQMDKDRMSIQVPNDGHLNELGHDLIARRLVEVIKMKKLLER